MAISSEVEILGAVGDSEPGLPEVRLRLASGAGPALAWGEVVLERHWADGSLGMRVRHLPDDGFAVDAPGYGAFEISPRGNTVTLHDLQGPPERWHQPLLGQALPIASTLAGHETLHASAVVIDGGAVAISAPSGTGKSSLMINLVDRGARPLADDVVALTTDDAGLTAHPGSPLAHIAAEQHAKLSSATRARLGDPLRVSDKLTFSVARLTGREVPLRAFATLRRSNQVSRLTITRAPAADPAELLATTFLPHVRTPTRVVRQLEVYALLARLIPVLRIDAPASVPSHVLASELESAVRASRGDRRAGSA